MPAPITTNPTLASAFNPSAFLSNPAMFNPTALSLQSAFGGVGMGMPGQPHFGTGVGDLMLTGSPYGPVASVNDGVGNTGSEGGQGAGNGGNGNGGTGAGGNGNGDQSGDGGDSDNGGGAV